jgi:hypothetical protein
MLKTRREVLDAVKAVLSPHLTSGLIDNDVFRNIAKDAVNRCPASETPKDIVTAVTLEMIVEQQPNLPEDTKAELIAAAQAARQSAGASSPTGTAAAATSGAASHATSDGAIPRLTRAGLAAFLADAREKRAVATAAARRDADDVGDAPVLPLPQAKAATLVIAGLGKATGQDAVANASSTLAKLHALFRGSAINIVVPLFEGAASLPAATLGSAVLTFPSADMANTAIDALAASEDFMATSAIVVSSTAEATIAHHVRECEEAARASLERPAAREGRADRPERSSRLTRLEAVPELTAPAPRGDDLYADLDEAPDQTGLLAAPVYGVVPKRHRTEAM